MRRVHRKRRAAELRSARTSQIQDRNRTTSSVQIWTSMMRACRPSVRLLSTSSEPLQGQQVEVDVIAVSWLQTHHNSYNDQLIISSEINLMILSDYLNQLLIKWQKMNESLKRCQTHLFQRPDELVFMVMSVSVQSCRLSWSTVFMSSSHSWTHIHPLTGGWGAPCYQSWFGLCPLLFRHWGKRGVGAHRTVRKV